MTIRTDYVFPTPLRSLLILIGVGISLPGCTPTTQAVPSSQSTPVVPTQHAPPAPLIGQDIGAGPDAQVIGLPPDTWHGNWRLVAKDDLHEQALMAFTIQSSAGENSGSGDYTLHQPFCDVVANVPISGTAECELTGLGGVFARVEASPKELLLTLHPTADGIEHRLELHHEGERLVGDYIFDGNDIHRAVIAERSPFQ